MHDAEAEGALMVSVVTFVDLWYVTQTTRGVTTEELGRLKATLAASDTIDVHPVDEVVVEQSPGERVTSIATDRRILSRLGGVLRVAAVPAGDEPLAARGRALTGSCGWDPEEVPDVEELAPVSGAEVLALREYDRQCLFLG